MKDHGSFKKLEIAEEVHSYFLRWLEEDFRVERSWYSRDEVEAHKNLGEKLVKTHYWRFPDKAGKIIIQVIRSADVNLNETSTSESIAAFGYKEIKFYFSIQTSISVKWKCKYL